jgi:PTS system nitrogen regulatory IIA component
MFSKIVPDGRLFAGMGSSSDYHHLMEKPVNVIAKLLTRGDICLDVDVSEKQQMFEQVGLLMEQRHGLAHDFVTRGLARREAVGSTGLGQGVAIPHVRLKGLNQSQALYLRPKRPLPFDAPDGMPVTDFLVLLVPEPASSEHLEILAEAARLFSDSRFREQLRACAGAGEVIRLFDTWS